MLTEFVNLLIDVLAGICSTIAFVLPASPFQAINAIAIDSKYLQIAAWFIPFPQIIATLQAWVTAIGLYYAFAAILRWTKAIGD